MNSVMDFHCGTTLRESIIFFFFLSPNNQVLEFYLDNWNIFRVSMMTFDFFLMVNERIYYYSNKILYFLLSYDII